MRVWLLALLIALSWHADARVRSVRHPPPERILWIGAHPDDESLVAPILGRASLENGDSCSLLVLTHGERGDCALLAGCGDLGSLRGMEMQTAADFFRAHLTLWGFADVLEEVIGTWSAEAGGYDALVSRIQSVIAAENPTVVYTFDPNHGSTCHAAHRAVGALVIEALTRLGSAAPRLLLVETTVDFLQNDFAFHSATPDAVAIDAGEAWTYLVRDIETHASQFTREQVEALRNTPAEQRRVWLASSVNQKYVAFRCGRRRAGCEAPRAKIQLQADDLRGRFLEAVDPAPQPAEWLRLRTSRHEPLDRCRRRSAPPPERSERLAQSIEPRADGQLFIVRDHHRGCWRS